jgi:hypothetical protein
MAHLGFLLAAYVECRFGGTLSALQGRSNSLSGLTSIVHLSFSEIPPPISMITSAQISTPSSQKAAALLDDPATVDIRRVGTRSKRILVVGRSE